MTSPTHGSPIPPTQGQFCSLCKTTFYSAERNHVCAPPVGGATRGTESEQKQDQGWTTNGQRQEPNPSQDAPVRRCCYCRGPIEGTAYTSGGVFWHPYNCLTTLKPASNQ